MSGSLRAGQPVIIGAGLAGMMTALLLAPRPCVLVTRGRLGEQAASAWAQGGIAAAVGPDDSPALHAADTIAAGDGLCDPAVVARITQAGPAAIATLSRFGTLFDRDPAGALSLGLEAAHGRRRIVHAGGDATGRTITEALAQAVRATPSVTLLEGCDVRRILTAEGGVSGVLLQRGGETMVVPAGQVVIATGGVGGLFAHTTNPRGALGQGLALAARAGARLAELEFVQFHPTALDIGRDPMPLVSEAVRGEGAALIDETGDRFLEDDLAPRDVVSRGVWRHMARGHRVFLDARRALGPRFAARFPGITAACLAAAIDPATAPIPIRPAAHYHMGGIAVDAEGRSSVPGLWACGEASATGLHGANRLASNSLLEAAVCAGWVAQSVAGDTRRGGQVSEPEPAPRSDAPPQRAVMTQGLGVLRNAAGMQQAVAALHPLAGHDDAALAALLIATAALRRRESRGGHFRTDFPVRAAVAQRTLLTLDDAMHDATELRAARLAG
jgi:L-aspartate oxidase